MADVLAGLQVADDTACAEFARRQGRTPGNVAALAEGAVLLSDVVARAQLAQPDALMAYKYPERFAPVEQAVLRQALDAAAAGDGPAAAQAIEPLPFADLAVIHSLAARLRYYATHLMTVDTRPWETADG